MALNSLAALKTDIVPEEPVGYRVTAWKGSSVPRYKMRFTSYYLAMQALTRWDDGEHTVYFETLWN